MRNMRPSRPFLLTLVAVLAIPGTFALSIFRDATDAPVGRLIANVTRYVRDHPADPEGYYVLGRIHSLAFSMRTRTLGHYERNQNDTNSLPAISDFQWGQRFGRRTGGVREPEPTVAELTQHLTESVRNFLRAIELYPHKGLYFLSLASVVEIGGPSASLVALLPVDRKQSPTEKQTKED